MSDTRGRKEFLQYVKNNKEKIDVSGGAYLYNFRCHANSVHFARKHEEDKIAMVVYEESANYPILHFVNINSDGNFIDNTLGTFTETYAGYYLIKILDESEFASIGSIFNSYLKEAKKYISLLARIQVGSGRIC